MSRTGSLKPVGAFSSVGSDDSESCVLAMQTGSEASPSRVNWSIFFSASR